MKETRYTCTQNFHLTIAIQYEKETRCISKEVYFVLLLHSTMEVIYRNKDTLARTQ